MSALQTAEVLTKRGHRVELICPQNSTIEKKANERNLQTFNVFGKSKRNSSDRSGFRKLNGINSIRKLISLLNREQFDVLHTHMSHDLWTIVPALKLSKCSSNVKLVLTKHMASGVDKKDFFHRLLYKRIDKIIAVSEFIKRSVVNTCPVDDDRVIVIPDAISTEIFDPKNFDRGIVRSEMGIGDNLMVIGMVGRMTPGKGHEDFLNAAKRIKEKSEGAVKFLIAGSASRGEDSYEAELKEMSKTLGLERETMFTGFREDMARVLAAIDILAFPSHEESFGITLIEAMAMEKPIAASNNAGVLDIVINGKTGILIPPKDPVSLANAILGLMQNAELRQKLGVAGRNRVDEKFNIEKTIEELERVYRE